MEMRDMIKNLESTKERLGEIVERMKTVPDMKSGLWLDDDGNIVIHNGIVQRDIKEGELLVWVGNEK